MGWFLLGLLLGIILGVHLLAWSLAYMYKEDPKEFDKMINILKDKVEERKKKNS